MHGHHKRKPPTLAEIVTIPALLALVALVVGGGYYLLYYHHHVQAERVSAASAVLIVPQSPSVGNNFRCGHVPPTSEIPLFRGLSIKNGSCVGHIGWDGSYWMHIDVANFSSEAADISVCGWSLGQNDNGPGQPPQTAVQKCWTVWVKTFASYSAWVHFQGPVGWGTDVQVYGIGGLSQVEWHGVTYQIVPTSRYSKDMPSFCGTAIQPFPCHLRVPRRLRPSGDPPKL